MPREPEFQFDIFLSHNSKDKPRVRKLAGSPEEMVAESARWGLRQLDGRNN